MDAGFTILSSVFVKPLFSKLSDLAKLPLRQSAVCLYNKLSIQPPVAVCNSPKSSRLDYYLFSANYHIVNKPRKSWHKTEKWGKKHDVLD